MAIHPGYADAILDGRKRVEFRKRSLAVDVSTVLMYATAPVKRIVGEFTVDRTLTTSPEELWGAVGSVGVIDEASYTAYFAGFHTATGILVSAPRRYHVAIPLAALDPTPAAPQSVTYLRGSQLAQLRRLAHADHRSSLVRLRLAGVLAGYSVPSQRASVVRRRGSGFGAPDDRMAVMSDEERLGLAARGTS
jgi:predicted transcriptional regulator